MILFPLWGTASFFVVKGCLFFLAVCFFLIFKNLSFFWSPTFFFHFPNIFDGTEHRFFHSEGPVPLSEFSSPPLVAFLGGNTLLAVSLPAVNLDGIVGNPRFPPLYRVGTSGGSRALLNVTKKDLCRRCLSYWPNAEASFFLVGNSFTFPRLGIFLFPRMVPALLLYLFF